MSPIEMKMNRAEFLRLAKLVGDERAGVLAARGLTFDAAYDVELKRLLDERRQLQADNAELQRQLCAVVERQLHAEG